jgi:hypothetical protein
MLLARRSVTVAAGLSFMGVLAVAGLGYQDAAASGDFRDWLSRGFDSVIKNHAEKQLEEGRRTFRDDTFGDEAFWGGVLRLHEAIEGEAFGGVGDGITPVEALGVGLKVDVGRLPFSLKRQLAGGDVDLDDPATTLALLRLKAVVGVTGFFDDDPAKGLTALGIQCAFCHSTVDDSFAPGIGRRLDGWANRDLNVGAIVNLSPDLSAVATLLGVSEGDVRTVLLSWGAGRFDAELFLDGNPDNAVATLIPPAFGLSGVDKHTFTGWGSVTYWNAFVANLEMHGQGTFYDPRLKDASKFPVAAANGFDDVRSDEDKITAKLAALHFYQLAIPAPAPPRGSFDRQAAERGKALFAGKADCARCHVPPLYTEPGWNMHTPDEIGIDAVQAERSPDERYRTTPLKGVWSHAKGGFYHDGRFPTLRAVVDHYDGFQALGLTPAEKTDLVEFLKSL